MKHFYNLLIFSIFISYGIFPISVGEIVSNVTIKDSSDNPAQISDLGKKVLTVFYTDPDVADQNDLLADMLKAEKFSKEKYRGVGIGNLKDSWKPDSLIRAAIRKKERKYDSKIMTDPDNLLKNAWNLGDCNEKSVVLVIDKQRRVQFFKKGALSEAERKTVLELIKKLMEQP